MVEPDGLQMTVWRMRFVCRITKARIQTQILLIHSNHGYANAPQCNVIHTLPLWSKCI